MTTIHLHETTTATPEQVLAIADHDGIYVGNPRGLLRERVGVA